MDATIVTALAGIGGSLCGGTASFATAWLTQKTRAKHNGIRAELNKREALYGEFINECSTRVIDSFERNLDKLGLTGARVVRQDAATGLAHEAGAGKPERLLSIYALLNRIRLCASDAVLTQAVGLVKFIMEQYSAPNVSVEEFHKRAHNGGIDPLKAFSEACRRELVRMHAET